MMVTHTDTLKEKTKWNKMRIKSSTFDFDDEINIGNLLNGIRIRGYDVCGCRPCVCVCMCLFVCAYYMLKVAIPLPSISVAFNRNSIYVADRKWHIINMNLILLSSIRWSLFFILSSSHRLSLLSFFLFSSPFMRVHWHWHSGSSSSSSSNNSNSE